MVLWQFRRSGQARAVPVSGRCCPDASVLDGIACVHARYTWIYLDGLAGELRRTRDGPRRGQWWPLPSPLPLPLPFALPLPGPLAGALSVAAAALAVGAAGAVVGGTAGVVCGAAGVVCGAAGVVAC